MPIVKLSCASIDPPPALEYKLTAGAGRLYALPCGLCDRLAVETLKSSMRLLLAVADFRDRAFAWIPEVFLRV